MTHVAIQLHNMSGAISASSLTLGGDVHTFPVVPADIGYLAWSMPANQITGTTTMATAGRLELVRVLRVPAGTITNIIIHVATAGSSLTSGQCFAALYTAAGARVGVTADQAVAWATSGRKVMALTAPYAHTGGDLYAGWWYNGTTGPTLIRMSGTISAMINGDLSAPNLLYATADTSLTTTAPDPFGAQTGGAVAWYVALS